MGVGVEGLNDKPKRIQRKRMKGWRMPPDAIYVGRPSKWGNPYMETSIRQSAAVAAYRGWIDHGGPTSDEIRRELRGKDLACWCALDEPCHSDVLLEIANE